MYVPKADQDWVEGHARFDDVEGGWRCAVSNMFIRSTTTGRSLHDGQFSGVKSAGSGRVLNVVHLYCPACNPDFTAPEYGTPIREEDLVYVT